MNDELDTRLGYQAPALEKGLEILEHLTDSAEPHTAAEIAKAVGRSRAEIYRVVVVLERRGYLDRSSDDRYRLSNKLFGLGMRVPPLRNLHDAAMPLMHDLAERLMQSCHLAVISGSEIVVVARVESPDQLGFAVRVGYRRPLHLTTSGRLICAHQSGDRRDALLAIVRRDADPADADRFAADCARAQADGFFAGASLFVDAVTDIGAPIFGGEGGAVASLVVPYVSGRSARSSLFDAIADLRATAAAISQRMTLG